MRFNVLNQAGGGGGGVASVTGVAPVQSSGGAAPAISIPASTPVTDGYMTAAQAALLASLPASPVIGVGATSPITSTGGQNPVIAIDPATGANAGSMSAADKTKLDGILPGAGPSVLRQTSFVEITTPTTMNSATFVGLLSKVITLGAGGILLVDFSASCDSANALGAQVNFGLFIDGVQTRAFSMFVGGPGAVEQCGALVYRKTGLAPGPHTIEIRWRRGAAGVCTINPVADPDSHSACLRLMEVTA